MADQVSADASNGRERLQLTLGSRSIGLTTNNLVTILLLVGGFICGYLVFLSITHQMDGLETRQKEAIVLMDVRAQAIITLLTAYDRRLDVQTEALRRWLLTHDYNTGRALEERLPLELPPGVLTPPGKP